MKKHISKNDPKRLQINQAALKQFSVLGYTKTTMDDIAESIGMKKASLYYYYENKEAIFKNVIEEVIDTFIDKVTKKHDALTTASEKLSYLFKAQSELISERFIIFNISINLLKGGKSVMYKMHKNNLDKSIALIITILQEGIDSGEFKKYDVRLTAEALHSFVGSLFYKQMQSKDVQSIEDINMKKLNLLIENTVKIFIHGLKA